MCRAFRIVHLASSTPERDQVIVAHARFLHLPHPPNISVPCFITPWSAIFLRRYCSLPTEVEWEFAARDGLMSMINKGEGAGAQKPAFHVGNAWQGLFPKENSKQDGFAGLSPVLAFPPNALGVSPFLSFFILVLPR